MGKPFQFKERRILEITKYVILSISDRKVLGETRKSKKKQRGGRRGGERMQILVLTLFRSHSTQILLTRMAKSWKKILP